MFTVVGKCSFVVYNMEVVDSGKLGRFFIVLFVGGRKKKLRMDGWKERKKLKQEFPSQRGR